MRKQKDTNQKSNTQREKWTEGHEKEAGLFTQIKGAKINKGETKSKHDKLKHENNRGQNWSRRETPYVINNLTDYECYCIYIFYI